MSMRLKRGYTEVDVRKGLESAVGGDTSDMQLNMRSYIVPASLASLTVICEKMMDDLAVQKSQDESYARAHALQQCWRQVPCLTRTQSMIANAEVEEEPVVQYSHDDHNRISLGKRLQHSTSIDDLFRDAQLLNNEFHTEIKSLLQSYGDACEFIPGPIKTPSRAIEKVVRRYCVSALHFLLFLHFCTCRFSKP